MDVLEHRFFVAQDMIEDILASLPSYYDIVEELMIEVELNEDDEALEDLLLLLEIKKIINLDDEAEILESLVMIYQQIVCSRIVRPYQQHFITEDGCNRVSWENLDEKYPDGIFKSLFRFEKLHIPTVIISLELPEVISFDGYMTTDVEALLLLLRRLSSCVRYIDISMEFDLLPQFQSQVFNGIAMFIFSKIAATIRRLNHSWMIERGNLETWSASLEAKGCPLPNTFGFADGTHVPVCRPKRGQRSWYCGHHKTHCFKALCVTTPAGIMLGFGPFDGTTHDSASADIVGLDQLLEEFFCFPDGTRYVLFLDPAYRIGQSMVTPFRRRRNITEEELAWNRLMCRDRVAVEWGFGKLKNIFRMLNNKKNLKALMSPVAVYFFVAMHLYNIHTILYGSQIADYFGVDPISLETYLSDFK